MKKACFFIALALSLASCEFKKISYLDFSNIDAADPAIFHPTEQKYTDLTKGFPDSTVLPDGTPVNEYLANEGDATKASSISAIEFAQRFLRWANQKSVIEISGTYMSVNESGDDIMLSGKVILPADKNVKRVILVSHYTIGKDSEAPSNTFPLEGQLAKEGYALIVPDYIGYGSTASLPHPYLMMDLTAINVIDMYFAVKPFLEQIGCAPKHPEIYLMGYSQGGGTTMAVQRILEDYYIGQIPIKRVFAGGGIYDVRYTFENFVETNCASYPCGVPFVVYGQVKGFHMDEDFLSKMLQPRIMGYLDDFFVKKKYSTKQMNEIIGTKKTDEILTKAAMDRTDYEVSIMYSMMTENSVLAYAWAPEAPVYMMHSIDDDTVPYGNATKAQSRWPDSNIQYNFGHYGNHVMCALRFIYTVKTLLEESND